MNWKTLPTTKLLLIHYGLHLILMERQYDKMSCNTLVTLHVWIIKLHSACHKWCHHNTLHMISPRGDVLCMEWPPIILMLSLPIQGMWVLLHQAIWRCLSWDMQVPYMESILKPHFCVIFVIFSRFSLECYFLRDLGCFQVRSYLIIFLYWLCKIVWHFSTIQFSKFDLGFSLFNSIFNHHFFISKEYVQERRFLLFISWEIVRSIYSFS